jgi:hypothetical protein
MIHHIIAGAGFPSHPLRSAFHHKYRCGSYRLHAGLAAGITPECTWKAYLRKTAYLSSRSHGFNFLEHLLKPFALHTGGCCSSPNSSSYMTGLGWIQSIALGRRKIGIGCSAGSKPDSFLKSRQRDLSCPGNTPLRYTICSRVN